MTDSLHDMLMWGDNPEGRDELVRLRADVERLRRRIVAHHELSTLSDEVIAETYGPGGTGACPICRRADQEATMKATPKGD